MLSLSVVSRMLVVRRLRRILRLFFADVKRRKVDLPPGSKVSIESF